MLITSSPHLIRKQEFESINIMRGIAILMVILVHTAQMIEGDMLLRNFSFYGMMGVQMFFIASAFTLSYSFDSRKYNNDPLRNFYLRRFFRIAPGYYFGIILYFILTSFFTHGVWVSDKNPINILANVFLLNGLLPSANGSVVPGGWSIGTEILFYLIFPLIFNIYNTLQNKYKLTYLIIPFCMLFLSVLTQSIFYIITKNPSYFYDNGFIYYSILNQLPVFCIGISLYIAFKKGVLECVKKVTCIQLAFLFSVISLLLILYGKSFFVLYSAIFPFISALSFAFVFILLQYFYQGRWKLIARIGVLSYSGYLIHFIFTFYFVNAIADFFYFIQSDILFLILYICTVALTFFSASYMYEYIELKGTKLGKELIAFLDKKSLLKMFRIINKNEAS